MTFYAFRLLSPVVQRWEADDDGVNLYHCADEGRRFFVEVGVDYGQEQPVVLRSFVSSVPLEDYSYWVKLPKFKVYGVADNLIWWLLPLCHHQLGSFHSRSQIPSLDLSYN